MADVKREGTDVTIIATGIMVQKALQAAMDYAAQGVSVEVIDPRTLVPLDEATILNSVEKTGRVIIVHEAVKRGGIGGEITSLIAERAFHALRAPIIRLGGAFVPMPYNAKLERQAVPQVEDIERAIGKLVRETIRS